MDMSSEFCGACGAVLLLCPGGATACDVCGSSLPNEEAGGGLKLVTRRRLAPSETLRQLTEAATDVGGAQEAVISETCPQCKNDKMSFRRLSRCTARPRASRAPPWICTDVTILSTRGQEANVRPAAAVEHVSHASPSSASSCAHFALSS